MRRSISARVSVDLLVSGVPSCKERVHTTFWIFPPALLRALATLHTARRASPAASVNHSSTCANTLSRRISMRESSMLTPSACPEKLSFSS